MPSQRLEDLHPLIAEKAQELIESAQAEGIEILVTSTLRSFEEQAELFAIGRTKPGKKVTNAEPGKSWHNFGLAFDVVPLVNGKAIFDSPFWSRIGELGKQVELVGAETSRASRTGPISSFIPILYWPKPISGGRMIKTYWREGFTFDLGRKNYAAIRT